MQSRREFLRLFGTMGAAALAASCGGGNTIGIPSTSSSSPSSSSGSLQSIEHVIFVMQENRSFDHYFGATSDYRRRNGIPGAEDIDGLPSGASNPSFTLDGKLDPADPVFAFHMGSVCHENLSSTWNESHKDWNFLAPASSDPKLDGFVAVAASWSRHNVGIDPSVVDIEGKRAMGFYTENELPFYYALASQFAMSDRYFCSALTHTQPNRMYLLAGSSYGRITSLKNYPNPSAVDAKTIFDLLNEHGITWKIYIHNRGGNPNAFTYFRLFKSYERMGAGNNPKIVDGSQFATDAQNGTLPQVSMIELTGGFDEHPGNNIQVGADAVRSYFTALMNSPSWTKSAILFTYDEHGAFYDHVPPPPAIPPDDIAPMFLNPGDVQAQFDRYGFRVPFVMASPWARKHYVSHQVADHTSILKFIETRFGLPSLTRRDAAAHDLLDMFDFSNMSWKTPPDLPSQPVHACGTGG